MVRVLSSWAFAPVLLATLILISQPATASLCQLYFTRNVETVKDFKAAADFALSKHAYHSKMDENVLGHFVQELPKFMDPMKLLFEQADIFRFSESDPKMVRRIQSDLNQNKISRMEVLFARLKMRISEISKALIESDVHKNDILNKAASKDELAISDWGKSPQESLENAKAYMAMHVRVMLEHGQPVEDAYQLSRRLLTRYLNQWNPSKSGNQIFEIMSKSFVSGLDPFSNFKTREEMLEDALMPAQRLLSGFQLAEAYRGILVTRVLPDSPAEHAGLLKGDLITHVEGQKIEGLSANEYVKHMNLIEHPLINLKLSRSGQELSLKVMRGAPTKRLVINSKMASTQNGNVVSIRLNDFGEGASRIFIEGLNNAFKQGPVAGVVLDLRGNPGGYVHEALQILRVFLSGQPVLAYQAQGNVTQVMGFNSQHPTLNIPLVVLINEGSASASELVSGVLKAEKRAIIVGSRSWGKGTAHSIVINEFGAMQLTQSFFHFTNGESPQLRGVTPDIRIHKPNLEKVMARDLDYALPEQSIVGVDRSQFADLAREQMFDMIKQVLETRSQERQSKEPITTEDAELNEAFKILTDWSELHKNMPEALPQAS